jgi:hypothetical protein
MQLFALGLLTLTACGLQSKVSALVLFSQRLFRGGGGANATLLTVSGNDISQPQKMHRLRGSERKYS